MTGPGRLFYETHLAPMMSLQGFAREITCTLQVSGGDPLPVLLSGVARRDAAGKLVRCDYTIFDARERRIYESELRAARSQAEELAALVRTSPNAIFRLDEAGVVKSWNAGAENLLQRSAEAVREKSIEDLIQLSGQRDWFGRAVDQCKSASEAIFETSDKGGRHFEITVIPVPDPNQFASPDYSVILREITARKMAERRLRIAMGEMKHRINNSLAVISGIARQTLPADLRDAFIGRLQALSRAHDVLAGENQEEAALDDLLALIADEAGGADRFRISGSKVKISPKQAQSISIAMHELVTNALKYGALSEPNGFVEVDCRYIDQSHLRLIWQEQGGPPVVPPTHRGFGSKMISSLLKIDLQAEVDIDYRPDGVRCEIAFQVLRD